MSQHTRRWDTAFKAGQEDHRKKMLANYDSWRRGMDAAGNKGNIFDIADLAVRQVLHGTPTGQPHETKPKKET